jgi:hypothetical protein
VNENQNAITRPDSSGILLCHPEVSGPTLRDATRDTANGGRKSEKKTKRMLQEKKKTAQ